MGATGQAQQLPWSPTSHLPGPVQRDWRGREQGARPSAVLDGTCSECRSRSAETREPCRQAQRSSQI